MSNVRAAVIGRLLVAAICACGAFALAIRGLEGWGWFLFAAICLGWITVSDSTSEIDD